MRPSLFVFANPSAPLDVDAVVWLDSQGITDTAIRRRYSEFFALCKALTPTLWGRLMMVSCRAGEAPLKTWGGGKSTHPTQIRGDFTTNGTVTFDSEGANVAYAASFANRVQTPTGFVYGTHRQEPYFMGLVYKNTIPGGKFQNGQVMVRWNVGTTSDLLTNYNGGDSQVPAWQVGVSISGAAGGQFVMGNQSANNSVDAPQFVGFDFQHGRTSVAQLSNENYQLATHASVSPSTSGVNTGLYFYPGIRTTGGTSGKLQYLVFISGGIIDIQSEAKKFWDIMRATLLFDVAPPIHFHQGGQSLSSGYHFRSLQMKLSASGRTVVGTAHSYGGTYISAWIGANPNSPARASQYLGGFFKGDGTGACENAWPFGNSKVKKRIVWMQGESDTELRSTALVYQQQLQNLLGFLTSDFGSDFNMAVNLVDYAIGYRTATGQGNFVLSGLTGAGASANGTWVISAVVATVSGGTVTNAATEYSWTKSLVGTIQKNGSGKWEIAIGGVVFATSVETTSHPELCTWVLSNGATGTLAFSETRTGNIERVRAAQVAFADANASRVFTFDSRGVTRPLDTGASGDAVHPDTAGQDVLAARAMAVMIP